jgi:CheY-like chemotaxis protein
MRDQSPELRRADGSPIMPPGFDGLEVLRRRGAETPDVPVLLLTAKDAVEDRVAGITVGGDDYVTKTSPTCAGRSTPGARR